MVRTRKLQIPPRVIRLASQSDHLVGMTVCFWFEQGKDQTQDLGRGLVIAARTNGVLSQEDIEGRLSKWLSEYLSA